MTPCAAWNAVITGSMVVVSALLPSNAVTISGNPVASVNNPTVICGSNRRSLENPGSRNPSPVSVSKYRVETSKRTSAFGPNAARAAHARANAARNSSRAYTGNRRFSVRYDAAAVPASVSTRAASTLLDGSMIRAITNCRKTASPPAASSNPNTR